jgi:hypothetical protein
VRLARCDKVDVFHRRLCTKTEVWSR